jgi:ligand-binding sensor domain-containing protein
MSKKIFQSLFLLFTFLFVEAQEILPLVKNYTKQDYNGDNQVWNIAQGKDNAMYFANNGFLLRYDGVKWEKYTLPNQSIIRSVYSFEDKIYTGSYNEFGFWKRQEGKMVYTSISKPKKIFENYTKSEEIWKIFSVGKNLYYQSFNELFIDNGTTIKKISFPFQISYCFVIEDEIYVATVRKGIYKLKEHTFQKIKHFSAIEESIVHGIEKNENSIFVFTQKNGVFISNNNSSALPWKHAINEKLKSQIIISAKILNHKLYIGTAFNGLYVVDLLSQYYYNINRSNVLNNNSVLNVFVDKEKNIWLGLDNGISYVVQNSPYKIFADYSGQLGTVYALSKINDGFLIGSNHGVFEASNKKIKLIPNSQGQVWHILKVNDNYVIGHNEGTFSYTANNYLKLNDLTGGWKLQRDKYSNDYIQSNYTGLYKYLNNDFSKGIKINDRMRPIKDFLQINEHTFVYTDSYRGLFKLELNLDNSIKKIKNLTEENKIENDYNVKLFQYKGTELFYINNSWYSLDLVNDSLFLNTQFDTAFKNIQELINIDDNNFLVNKNGVLYLINQVNKAFIWTPIPLDYYQGKLINNETKVFQVDNKFMVNMDDGFLIIDSIQTKKYNQKITIEAFNSEHKIINNGDNISYKDQLKVYVISEYFGSKKTPLFYKVDNDKIQQLENGYIDLKNLSSGSHIITIYNSNESDFKKIKTFSFTVLNPWYLSFWMKILYFMLISLAFYLYYKWNKLKYYQKLKLKEEELKHKNEILRLEIEAENKLKLQEYEKHLLENQVQVKANELASKSLSIAKQTELIESIQKILDTETSPISLKNKIAKAIKINSLNKNEWKSFEDNLLKSNEDFVKELSKHYKNLTSKDIKLCIYLKMNLSSKEIAPLMNISYRGVELHRYRLRKKMGLSPSINLNLFMNNII